jgi:uncharacterized protein YggE
MGDISDPEVFSMSRLFIAIPALFAVVALAGALGPPDFAGAQQSPTTDTDSITVTGVGKVEDVPDQAQMTFGVESRGATAKAAIAANATAMEKLVAALRQAGAREIATQWVSVYPVTREDGTSISGYSATNSVSATIGVARAGELIDAASDAGANTISGPGLSSSDSERLYRQALAAAVEDARERAEILARAANRPLGEISTIVEGGGSAPVPFAEKAALDAATPIVPGEQETSATVSVTFDLR